MEQEVQTIEDVCLEHFTAAEWREIAIQNHRAKDYYWTRMREMQAQLREIREIVRSI